MKPQMKKYPDILSRFRNDVQEFSSKFGGVAMKKKNFKAPVSRKEKRKLERQLKHAKNLAFRRAEKMPTLDALISSAKKGGKKQIPTSDSQKEAPSKSIVATKSVKKESPKILPQKNVIDEAKKPATSLEIVENKIKSEENKRKKYEASFQKISKKKLLEDNERDEKEIARLEKKLHITKGSKKYKQVFYDEGFADLLDFCDEEKRKEMLKNEGNLWFDLDQNDQNKDEKKKDKKKKKIEKLNEKLSMSDESSDSENSMQSNLSEEESDEDEDNGDEDGFFKQPKKKVRFDTKKELNEIEDSADEDDEENDDEDDDKCEFDEDEENDGSEDEEEEEINSDDDINEEDEDIDEDEDEDAINDISKKESQLKEDIYGRLIDKKGNVVKSEKYIPPAQRLKELLNKPAAAKSQKLINLSKKLNGLLNRLSTSNMHSICNEFIQIFYSNEFTRYDLIQTLQDLLTNSLIKSNCLTPIRLIVEHSALVAILSSNIGVELGANMLQTTCLKINEYLNDKTYLNVENKTLDNLILLLCNLYNFKLFSSNLLIDLLNDHLIEFLNGSNEESENDLIEFEKRVDLILLIFRCVGFSLRKENPVMLKEAIIKLQTKINLLKAQSKESEDSATNNRLKFMIESINAIKNNDIRRLDSFDQQPIEQIKKQVKTIFKEEKDHTQLNISFKDIINADELGRWWIVGSAWTLKENESSDSASNGKHLKDKELVTNDANGEKYSEKILKLAKEQHMNTDVRRAVFCIILSAEDYTDAFMKLVKLSLKKQQEREIVYVIVHCALNEKKYNPYYSFLMQKFCDYDRRFKMTLQFYTWDKFKMLNTMTVQQITNFANFYTHLIGSNSMSLSILKNAEFGEMNKYMLQFLSELLKNLFLKNNDEKIQETFMRIATTKALYQLRNALKLFIVHFMLTDKGKEIEVDPKLKAKCELVQKVLSINSDD